MPKIKPIKKNKNIKHRKNKMSIAGKIDIGKKNEHNELVHDKNIQEFEGLPFRIKVETIPKQDNVACLLFLDKNKDVEIDIPEGFFCKDVTFKYNTGLIPPYPSTQGFLLVHPNIYNFYYDPTRRKTIKKTKIYSVNSQKKFIIHNYRKTSKTLENERINRKQRDDKRLNNAINSIIGLDIEDKEEYNHYDDYDDEKI